MTFLEQLREEINEVDRQLVPLLEKRMVLSGKVGRYKQQEGIAVKDSAREEAILKKNTALLSEPELSESITNLYRAIFEESRRLQETEGHKHA